MSISVDIVNRYVVTRVTKSQYISQKCSAFFKAYETSNKPNFTLIPSANPKVLGQKVKIYHWVYFFLQQFFLFIDILSKLQ